MDNKIIQRIEDLKMTTESHIGGIQKCLVPTYIDLNATIGKPYAFNPTGNIAQYNIGDEIRFVDNSVCFAIRVHNLPYIEEQIITNRDVRYFKDSLTNMISNQEIRPIMIFYDNRFIAWSRIDIVKNKDDSWILIKDLTDFTKEIRCISFPFNIEYNENGFDKESAAFIFDDEGKLNTNGNYVISITNKNVICKIGSIDNTRTINKCEIDAPEEYLYFPFNCFIFKDDVLYPDAKVSFEGYNIITVDDGLTNPDNNISYIFFYNKYTSIAEGNPMFIENRDIVKNAIIKNDDNINRLGQHLDFSFSPNAEYINNIKAAINNVEKHNGTLLEKIYKDISRIETVIYSGKEFKALIKSGRIKFATKRIVSTDTICRHNPSSPITYDTNHLIELRPMIFVNGILSNMMRTIKIEDDRYCVFETDGNFSDTDSIEIIFFKDINNEIIKSHTVVDENNYISYACTEDVLNKISKDDLMAFSPIAPANAIFGLTSIDEHDRVQYTLPIETIEDDNKKINLKINSEYDYSGERDITFTAKNQFHHLGISIVNDYQFNVLLTPEFNYCVDKDHYMIFINGRKIEQSHFKLISADPKYPFDDVSVYLFFEMEKGDRIDIFYLPINYREHVIRSKIPTNGNIYLDKYLFNYTLSKNLHLFFLNGKKILQNDIVDIDASRVCINNNSETVNNLCIIQHIPPDEILNELFKDENLRSIWDDVFGSLDQDTIRDLLGIDKNINITNNESNIYEWQLTAKEVIFEIARDYWLSERIYTGDVFVYNYDNIELTKEDFINEELAKIDDFTKKDPTGKTIANLQHGHVDFLRTKNGQPASKEDIDKWNSTHPKK